MGGCQSGDNGGGNGVGEVERDDWIFYLIMYINNNNNNNIKV